MSVPLPTSEWMLNLREDDIFEVPGLLPGLSVEPIVFKVLELVKATEWKDIYPVWHMTVHVYYHDVLIARGSASFSKDANPFWSFR